MNPDKRQLTLYRLEDGIEALVAPLYPLTEGMLHGGARLRAHLATRAAARRRDRAIANTMRQLSALEDRVLHDIGVTRGNIHAFSIAVVDNPGQDPRKLVSE